MKIRSLIKLKKIDEANKLINENKEIASKNKQLFFEIEEDIKNKMKNIKGEYDFSDIYEKSKKSFNIDIGEYINSKLEIRHKSNKGISVYSKEKLHKGELLIVSSLCCIRP